MLYWQLEAAGVVIEVEISGQQLELAAADDCIGLSDAGYCAVRALSGWFLQLQRPQAQALTLRQQHDHRMPA